MSVERLLLQTEAELAGKVSQSAENLAVSLDGLLAQSDVSPTLLDPDTRVLLSSARDAMRRAGESAELARQGLVLARQKYAD